jgi:hypothetical protein
MLGSSLRVRCLGAAILALTSTSCARADWLAGPTVLADPCAVASTVGDAVPSCATEIGDLPELGPPAHLRACCAFGMDLEVDFAGMRVPFFEVGNVIAPDGLGHHAYAHGLGAPDPEANGLVYTCRGGWIDVAHVRENADLFLFYFVHIAADLAGGTTTVVPGHGAETTVTVAPIPPRILRDDGALEVATILAAWTTWRVSIWHEVSTWYGYESVSGFSERPSTFSPEDLYSNALGIGLGVAIAEGRDFATDEVYSLVLGALLEGALDRLDAQPLPVSRAIMHALDERWWSSAVSLPDDHLVLRRALPTAGDRVVPWRAEDAFADGEVPASLATACADAPTRSLRVPSHVGPMRADELVSIHWAPEGWAEGRLPAPGAAGVDDGDLDALVADVARGLGETLGPHFARPR